MWPFDQTIVAVDARSVAVIVQRDVPGRRSVLRFESASLPGSRSEEPLRGVAEAAADEARRLVRSLSAPVDRLSIVLPVGCAFPAVVPAGDARGVGLDDVVRFRLSSTAPFPVHDATTVRDARVRTAPGSVFAEVLPKAHVDGAKRLSAALGCPRPRIHSALGAALRALPAASAADGASADVVFGDAAYAIAERDASSAITAVLVRFLAQGEDRVRRAIEDAFRREPAPHAIRVAGPGASVAGVPSVVAAFTGDAATWPVLAVAAS